MSETFLNKAQLTGLGPDARRTEILRAKGIAELDTRLTAVEAEITPWTDFAPSWTNYTRGDGTYAAQFRYVGGSMEIWVNEVMGTTSAMGTAPSLAVPDGQSYLDDEFMPIGMGTLVESGVAARVAMIRTNGGLLLPYWFNPTLVTPTPTVPFTWGTGDAMRMTISIRVAR